MRKGGELSGSKAVSVQRDAFELDPGMSFKASAFLADADAKVACHSPAAQHEPEHHRFGQAIRRSEPIANCHADKVSNAQRAVPGAPFVDRWRRRWGMKESREEPLRAAKPVEPKHLRGDGEQKPRSKNSSLGSWGQREIPLPFV